MLNKVKDNSHPTIILLFFLPIFVTMTTKLFKRKVGKPLKHDFSGLKIGQAVKFADSAQPNPFPFAAYWNENNKIKIEVWRDKENIAYAKRVK